MDCHNRVCSVPVGKVFATLETPQTCCHEDIVPLGERFANLTVKNGVIEVVSPAANRHGLVIRTCALSGDLPASGMQLYAGADAPSGYNDGNRKMIFSATMPPTTSIRYPIHVPAGQGVWYAAENVGYLNMTYDFLAPENP